MLALALAPVASPNIRNKIHQTAREQHTQVKLAQQLFLLGLAPIFLYRVDMFNPILACIYTSAKLDT